MKRCRQLIPELPSDISEWWERFMDITIVCRSLLEPSSSICDMFGISDKGSPDLLLEKIWKLEVFRVYDDPADDINEFDYSTLIDKKMNTLFVPLPGTSGFDSLVMLYIKSKPRLFYNQVKIDIPKNKPFEQLVCDMICYNLLHYFNTICNSDKKKVSLEDVHMIIYNWGEEDGRDKLSSMNKTMCNDAISKKFNNIKDFPGSKNKALRKLVNEYVDNHIGSNVHVVGRRVLKDWILPSFIPFPVLFTELGFDDK
jgi:hypothetical protein